LLELIAAPNAREASERLLPGMVYYLPRLGSVSEELRMFTRRVIIKIKPDSATEFSRIVESEVAPPLREQRGCRHEETFITPELREAVLNSYWDTEGYADAYHGAVYPEALAALAGVIDGSPLVENFGISISTFHEITANRRLASRASQSGRG
jgi:hypothetical protein